MANHQGTTKLSLIPSLSQSSKGQANTSSTASLSRVFSLSILAASNASATYARARIPTSTVPTSWFASSTRSDLTDRAAPHIPPEPLSHAAQPARAAAGCSASRQSGSATKLRNSRREPAKKKKKKKKKGDGFYLLRENCSRDLGLKKEYWVFEKKDARIADMLASSTAVFSKSLVNLSKSSCSAVGEEIYLK
ncbi:hypothetical protein BC937DRAFT_92278 [Endogone sp. FLAS-F59071]|nr:hypothetical protein BC937DRAFT_92278 [Endogone sp. FLAS-F59071]|eukprot:RUS15572.1 hypothetical protein BC937DRAFT_92278 [Endogone sp. FLAS-F59071]